VLYLKVVFPFVWQWASLTCQPLKDFWNFGNLLFIDIHIDILFTIHGFALISMVGKYISFTLTYPSMLANLTLVILFSEMLKFWKNISSKSKNIVKDNIEYFKIFHLLEWIFQIYLFIWRTCVEMAKVLR
jgi:hypothetical protein